jgi:hypothetical protein
MGEAEAAPWPRSAFEATAYLIKGAADITLLFGEELDALAMWKGR